MCTRLVRPSLVQCANVVQFGAPSLHQSGALPNGLCATIGTLSRVRYYIVPKRHHGAIRACERYGAEGPE